MEDTPGRRPRRRSKDHSESQAVTRTVDERQSIRLLIQERRRRLVALIETAFFAPERERADIVRHVVHHALIEPHGGMGSDLAKIGVRLVDLGFPEEALQLARSDPYWRSCCLVVLTPKLMGPLKATVLSEALDAVKEERIPSSRAWHLAKLIPHVTESARAPVIQAGLDAAREISPTEHKGYAAVDTVSKLALFVPFVSDERRSTLIAEMRTKLDAISVPARKARAIADSLEYLHEPIRGELLHEAIAIAQSLPDCRERAWQLGWLLPHVAESVTTELLEQALRAAEDVSFEDELAKAIAHLARFFSLETARGFAKNIKQDKFEWSWGWCLTT
jgi:hypothetical protein